MPTVFCFSYADALECFLNPCIDFFSSFYFCRLSRLGDRLLRNNTICIRSIRSAVRYKRAARYEHKHA